MNNLVIGRDTLGSKPITPPSGAGETPNFSINRGLKIELGFKTADGDEYLQVFTGKTTIPNLENNNKILQLQAFDAMDALASVNLTAGGTVGVPLYENVNTKAYIQACMYDVWISTGDDRFSADNCVFDDGLQTIRYAWFGSRKASEEIRDAVEAEGGRFFVNEEGKFVFHNRLHNNVDSDYRFSQIGLNKMNATSIIWDYDISKLINKCRVSVKPRKKASTYSVQWTYGEVLEFTAGQERTFFATFTPQFSVETLTATTDYTANNNADGSGTNRTGDVTVVSQYNYIEDSFIKLKNNTGTTFYLTKLELRATPLDSLGEVIVESKDDTSITNYGEHVFSVTDNKYIQDPEYAQDLADNIIALYSTFFKILTIECRARPALRIGEVVTVIDMLDNDYVMRVISNKITYDANGMNQVLKLRELAPSEIGVYFEIGVSEIEGSDVIKEGGYEYPPTPF